MSLFSSERLAKITATFFYTGLSPKAPGTVGSLAAVLCAYPLVLLGGKPLLFICWLAVLPLGLWASSKSVDLFGKKDASAIVIDEVAGQWIPLFFLPLNPYWYFLAFLAFRFFDILKIQPVRWADQRLPGGIGIMTDDILAGLYAAAVTSFLWHFVSFFA